VVDEKSSASRGGIGRGIWIVAGVVLVAVVFGIYRIRHTGFRWDLFLSTFQADWRWMALAMFFIFLTYLGRALRWQVMLRPIRPSSSLWNITSATVIGFTAIVLLGRPGELVRPYLISVKERVPFSSQMAAWFLERIFDLLVVLIIFGIALARMPAGLHLGAALHWVLHTGGYFVASLGALCILLLVAFRNFAVGAQARILSAVRFLPEKLYSRVENVLSAFVQGMECTHDLNNLGLLIGYTIVEWVIIVSGYYFMFRAMPATADFSLNDVMIFLGFVAFGSVVQVPGIGGGVQVASFLVLHEIFHIKGELATGMAILIWLLSWVLVVPVGLAFAFHEGINWSKISHISENVESGAAK
jgi:uncharacterized protein (TIRG00374 family)